MFSPTFSTNFINISQSKAKCNVKIRGKNLWKKFMKTSGELNHVDWMWQPCSIVKKTKKCRKTIHFGWKTKSIKHLWKRINIPLSPTAAAEFPSYSSKVNLETEEDNPRSDAI